MAFLCNPIPEITCFGCCPPIRPAHYDPLDYVGSLRREFIDNRRRILKEGARRSPIVGYSCWALGFLDKEGKKIGCLLHPGQNGGRDLRFLIDYGNKCSRESCFPARMFERLPPEGQVFWLEPAKGLNAFLFSSRKGNPLFHLLPWGPEVLEELRARALQKGWTATEVLWRHPFLTAPSYNPKAHRYLFRLVLDFDDGGKDGEERHEERFGKLWRFARALAGEFPPESASPDAPYTHLLPLDVGFTDFLRLAFGSRKMEPEKAAEIKSRLDGFAAEISRRRPPGCVRYP
jgi:hypothetical protein